MSVVSLPSSSRLSVSAPLLLLAGLLSLLVACAPESRAERLESEALKPRPPAVGGPRYGGHLRVGHSLEPTSLDAILGRSGADAYFWRQIFDQLVDADQQLHPRPETSLATSWEIATDPDSITFHLREGVVFHDGTPFNAHTVKTNIERILDPATVATPRASLAVIEGVEVIDEYTVRFDLAGPWGAGFGMLADRGGVMSSPAAIESLGADYGWSPSGTGPFRVKEVITGTLVHFVRNEDYWGRDEHGNQLPYLDEVTVRVIRDETVRAAALRTGEIDVTYLPYKDVATFERDERVRIETMPGGGIALTLVFNVDKPPLDDVNVRLAIAHAVDPTVINRAIFFGRAIEADAGMWPVGAWVHEPDAERPYYDVDKARRYLEKAGRESGLEFTAVTHHNPLLVSSAEVVRAMLKKIGIHMDIDVLSSGPATERFNHGQEYPMFITSWSRYPEPDWMASLAYKSDGYYNPGNVLRPDVDELVELGASLYDNEARKQVYIELNRTVLGEAWFTPLLYGVTFAAAPGRVRNLDQLMGWDGKMNFATIWLEE